MKSHFCRILAVSFFISLIPLFGCGPKYKVHWEEYSAQRMEAARQSGQPIIVFFTAAWCPPCYNLKDKTFTKLEVVQKLEPYIRLKADMSYQHSEKVRALGEEFQVSSLPTILIFTPGSKSKGDLRLRGYMPADHFIEALEQFERGG